MAAIHAVVFPAPLQGTVGPSTVVLRPKDPADELRAALRTTGKWIEEHRPALTGIPEILHGMVDRRASEIRAEQPCLLHGDVNLDNFIVTDETVRLIDWDSPEVGYPLAELGNLDQQVYLNGASDGLPPEFWEGYGRTYHPDSLLIYRAVRCLQRLASPTWAEWEADPDVSPLMKAELRRRRGLLEAWGTSLPAVLQGVADR